MKILFTQKMNGISGSELYLMQIMPELKKRGYHVQMLIVQNEINDKNQAFKAFLADNKISFYELSGYHIWSIKLLLEINKILKIEEYDIIITNLIHADFWLALTKFIFNRNIKILSIKHGFSESYQAKYGFDAKNVKKSVFFWIEWFACKLIDKNVAISDGLKNLYIDSGIVKKEKITTIHYGFKFDELLLQKSIPNDETYLLIIGRLIPVKGHIYLINAWKKINLSYPNLKLYIVGSGVLMDQLTKLVLANDLQNNVIFKGHVFNPHYLIQNSLFTVFSSKCEGFGITILESWFHKKTVVAFDRSPMNEIIDDNNNGVLVPAMNSEMLADSIIKLLGDPNKIAKMGVNGYSKLNQYFTLERMTDETEKIISSIISY